MAPATAASSPPLVLALALASVMYLLLAIVRFLARAVPRLVENAKPVPRLSIDLDDGEDNCLSSFFGVVVVFYLTLVFACRQRILNERQSTVLIADQMRDTDLNRRKKQ